jgi:hypothetical protein
MGWGVILDGHLFFYGLPYIQGLKHRTTADPVEPGRFAQTNLAATSLKAL